MLEFIKAALPWVVMGVVIAIFAAQNSNRKKATDKGKKKQESYMNEGMCVGLCLGVCIASAGVWDMGIGISLGLCAGLLIGSLVKKQG